MNEYQWNRFDYLMYHIHAQLLYHLQCIWQVNQEIFRNKAIYLPMILIHFLKVDNFVSILIFDFRFKQYSNYLLVWIFVCYFKNISNMSRNFLYHFFLYRFKLIFILLFFILYDNLLYLFFLFFYLILYYLNNHHLLILSFHFLQSYYSYFHFNSCSF